MNYTLRSHEKLSKVQVGDGIPSFDVTYEILRDGKPLGFFEHAAVVDRMNVNADPVVVRRREERERALHERFAQLRAAHPELDYDEIMGHIHDEEIEADEAAHLRMVDVQDEERAERYMEGA